MFAKNDAIYAFSSGRIKKIENLTLVEKNLQIPCLLSNKEQG